jgi:type I restriction enzyme S subunit
MMSGKMYRFRVPEEHFDARYLEAYLQTLAAQAAIDKMKTGGSDSGLNLTHDRFRPLPVPVAPLAEQRRIMDTLDELLSDLDAGVAAIERAQAKLKHFRAAVLKAAVEGALSAEWRARNPDVEPAPDLLQRILKERRCRWEETQLQKFKDADKPPPKGWRSKYKTPEKPERVGSATLPVSWAWTGFEELSDGLPHSLKAGPFGSALKKEFYTPSGIKIYGQEQVISGDPFFGDYFISEERFENLKSCAVKSGDILISLVGTTGKVLVLPEGIVPGIINPRLLKISLLPGHIAPSYLKLVLESPQARAFFKAKAHGGTMDVLNLGILKEFSIPLPPIHEQAAIIEAVEDQLSIIDHLEADLGLKLKSAVGLRQSILRHAFTGQLVPQNPNDEPASCLLKRIVTEREERIKLAQGAKKKVNSKTVAQRKRTARKN